MLLDVLAAVARKEYDDRRRRQAEGQAKAKRRPLAYIVDARKTRLEMTASLSC